MIRQSKTTIKELSAQYRAVLRHAFLAGVICAVSMTTSGARAAINVQPGSTDITNDVISTVVANADTRYSDGSYFPQTWDSELHDYVEGASTDVAADPAGAAPSASSVEFDLKSGPTDLAEYNGGSYTIADPTADPAGITVDATTYTYTHTAADGSTSVVNLTAGDVSDTPVLATTGYDYAVTTAYRVAGDSSVNIDNGTPSYSDYQFSDGENTYNLADYVNSDGDLVLPNSLLENLTAVAEAGSALAAYGNDTTAYETVNGNYATSNTAYGAAVADVNADQATVNAAIETYRNQVGTWKANDNTHNAYVAADAAADAYNNSLANVIDTHAQGIADTAEQNAKDYADGLADNYDAAGSADTAEQNAKDYADSLADNYDAAGSADTAEQNAKDYADSLADNYDAAGSADTAEQNAKDYADSLADNYDAAGSADAAEQNANAYTDGKIAEEAETRDGAIATAKGEAIDEANGYTDGKIDTEKTARESADQELQDAIEAEAGRATAAENALRNEFASANAETLARANAYTDKKVDTLEKNVSGGVAAATALSAVSVSNVKRGEVSVGGGYGYYNDQSAVAFGATMGLSDNWSVNAGAGVATGDKTQFAIRAGTNYKFKLF